MENVNKQQEDYPFNLPLMPAYSFLGPSGCLDFVHSMVVTLNVLFSLPRGEESLYIFLLVLTRKDGLYFGKW